jgi:hypothetical protein
MSYIKVELHPKKKKIGPQKTVHNSGELKKIGDQVKYIKKF